MHLIVSPRVNSIHRVLYRVLRIAYVLARTGPGGHPRTFYSRSLALTQQPRFEEAGIRAVEQRWRKRRQGERHGFADLVRKPMLICTNIL